MRLYLLIDKGGLQMFKRLNGFVGFLSISLLLFTSSCEPSSTPPSVPTSTIAIVTPISMITPVAIDTREPRQLSIEVTEIYQWEDDLTGDVNFVGILRNVGNVNAEMIRPVVTMRDSIGNIVASGSADISFCSDFLGVSQFSPFWIRLSVVDPWETYEVIIQAEEQVFFTTAYYKDFEVVYSQGRSGDFGSYRVFGEIRNVGSIDAQFTQVVVTLYDPSGNLVAAQCDIADVMDIPPGGISPFDTEFFLLPEGYDLRFEVYARAMSN